MTDSSVLVPGTGGITLMDSNGNDLGYPIRMQLGVSSGGLFGRSAADLVELLSMSHLPGQLAPAKTSLLPGISIRPGHVLEVAYNQLPSAFNRFLYDWRADLRYSASQLLDFLRERKPPQGRWNVVGHSQGGLLVVLASKLAGAPDEFARLARSVVLVGTPLSGTVNAAQALIAGDLMGQAGEAAFQSILRTWPALFQMLPAWPALVHPDKTPASNQLLSAGGWGETPGIFTDLLTRGQEAQQGLRDPFSNMQGPIKLAIVMARTRATAENLEQTSGLPTAQPLAFELGDTLVLHDRTKAALGGANARFVTTLTGPINEHAFLCTDPAVLSVVRQAVA